MWSYFKLFIVFNWFRLMGIIESPKQIFKCLGQKRQRFLTVNNKKTLRDLTTPLAAHIIEVNFIKGKHRANMQNIQNQFSIAKCIELLVCRHVCRWNSLVETRNNLHSPKMFYEVFLQHVSLHLHRLQVLFRRTLVVH